MVEIEEYTKAFNDYKCLALENDSVSDILQYGSIKSPGISDIDTILVINKWIDFKPSIRLLNPERLSPLFTHGPVICEKSSLDKLFMFTTLQAFEANNFDRHPYSENQVSKLICVLIRQTGYFLHFNNVKNRLSMMDRRQILLISKSLTHSFLDLQSVGLLKDSGRHLLLFDILSENNSIDLKKNDTILLSNYFIEYVNYGVEVLSTIIEEQLSNNNINYNGRVNIDLLNWFQIEIECGKVYGHSNEDAFNTIIKWKKFYNEMSCGYINSGAQWKGAEFTFMNFKPFNVAHPNLFLRRVIKHSNILFRIKNQLN